MTRQRLTFQEAVELLVEAKVIDGSYSVGSNRTKTELVIPVGGIDADKDGFFKRSDVCKLISYHRFQE